MTQQQQEQIVIECHRLALELKSNCAAWLHTAIDRRNETAALSLSASADALYTLINNNPDIMRSDAGKPAFDEFNKVEDDDFQDNMNKLWSLDDQPEPDFREIRRMRNETN